MGGKHIGLADNRRRLSKVLPCHQFQSALKLQKAECLIHMPDLRLTQPAQSRTPPMPSKFHEKCGILSLLYSRAVSLAVHFGVKSVGVSKKSEMRPTRTSQIRAKQSGDQSTK
jgi:hypothetical protein